MRYLTIASGVVLSLLGGLYFYVADTDGLFTLLPFMYGCMITMCGILDDRWHNRYPFYLSVMLMLLTFFGSLRSFFNLFSALTVEGMPLTPAVIVRSCIGLLALLYVVLAIAFTDEFWLGWKAFGHVLGNWVGRAAMTVFYFTIFLPFGLGVRLFADPLRLKSQPPELWRPRTTGDQTEHEMRRQY